jgi:hypothetical protein
MKNVWENDIKGQPHKVVFVNKRSTFQTFAFNNRDMQFLEGQKEAWNQVIANFNMTPADLGITRDLHRSSASNMTEQTKKKLIKPLMKKIEHLINSQLLPEIASDKVSFQFIVNDPTEERQLVEIAEIKLRNNITTPNEVRIELGLSELEDGDLTNMERQEQQFDSMNPFGQEPKSHHKPGEIREQRDGTNESAKRERESNTNKPDASVNKDYQQAFQAQIPFNSMIQNLSSPVPSAFPKQNHPNTMSPYKELAGMCPKCGSEQIQPDPVTPGSLATDIIMRCHTCQATFRPEEFKQAVEAQEHMHEGEGPDPLAPKAVQAAQYSERNAMLMTGTTTPNLVATSESQGEAGVPQKQSGSSIDTAPVKTDPFRTRNKSKKVKTLVQ